MREQDTTLQYWSERIDSLSVEYDRAKSNTFHLLDQAINAHKLRIVLLYEAN